ncbi:MBL fold metallo-hydrolase [Thermogladius sp. 4427co]|uniref:MBL fold metallo-hydrolase n=1 Tax=Thermogladius sp. 4427co TaxID=3450718 RepID=UPI003F7ADB61
MEVSRLNVLILVDDYSGFQAGLLAEHGFSVLIEVEYDNSTVKRILFDTGGSGRVLLSNSEALGIDLRKVDAIVLSHGHWDHTGGITALSDIARGRLLIAHPDILKPCYSTGEKGIRYIGLSKEARNALETVFHAMLVRNPLEIFSGIWFLGEVERFYDNSYAIRGFKTIQDGVLIDNPMLDDTGLAINVGDYAIVLAGCSHSGVSNIVRQARRVTGRSRIVLIGGFHLAGSEPPTIERVVKELVSEGVEYVYPGHCTGLRAEAKLLDTYGDRMEKIYSGFRKEFRPA